MASKIGRGEQNLKEGKERWETLRKAAGISLVGFRLPGELSGGNEGECRSEKRGCGCCLKSANGDSVTVEARAGTGKVAGGEEGCIA